MSAPNNRLLALDVIRGITIAGMILVNNPGSWQSVYAPLQHARWHGLTPTDLVYPFFMFIMGVAIHFSLRKFDKLNTTVSLKIIRRTVALFAVGIALDCFSLLRHFLLGTSAYSRCHATVGIGLCRRSIPGNSYSEEVLSCHGRRNSAAISCVAAMFQRICTFGRQPDCGD